MRMKPIHTVRLRRLIAGGMFLALLSSCDDPTQPIHPPADLARAMTVRLLLVPGTDVQPLWVTTLDVGDLALIDGLSVTVTTQNHVVAQADSLALNDVDMDPCHARYGVLALESRFACVGLSFDPVPSRRYEVTVAAANRPTATASVVVPGDFRITELDASGNPPGTDGLTATWTRSDSAYAYLVSYVGHGLDCSDVQGCPNGWFVTTPDTTLTTVVPEPTLTQNATWSVDVFAIDKGLFDYLTTGSGDAFFAVPPVSNVQRGYGFVGAWIHKP